MNLHIRSWYGRFGNNVHQIQNCLYIALENGYNIILPPHEYFNTTYIVLNDKVSKDDQCITDKDNFFYRHSEITKESRKILQGIFKIKADKIFSERDIIVHLRGGDIFTQTPHKLYITPPLSYFENIIDRGNYENIIIVSEDRKNPIVNRLLQKYKNAIHQTQSLTNDIKIILGAKNIIESVGTFVTALAILSNVVENLHVPSYKFLGIEIDGVNTIKYDLEEYRQKMFPWKNTKEQISIMLT
jgi:hypothetical protein